MSRIETCRKNLLYLPFLLTIFICFLFDVEGRILVTFAKFLYLYYFLVSFVIKNLAKARRILPSTANK